jgi:pyruvate dehydrogenase E1 component beta subunit
MVLMTSVGGGYGDAGQHSQSLYATFGHLPGLKVVIPSNAHDAKGLMLAAIRDPNPVVFMYHKALQGMGWLGTVKRSITDVPEEGYVVPIGKASVVRPGRDISIVGLGLGVHQALDAAEQLAGRGIEAEVIDLISIAPLDRETIRASARRTGRLLVIDDDYLSYGVGAEVIASVCEDPTIRLSAPPRRIAHPDIPVPFTPVMEHHVLPSAEKLVAAALDIMEHHA